VQGIREVITDSLKAAEWPYRDDGPPLAIGTSLFHDGMIVGGSIQVFEDIEFVRIIAFGAVGHPGACRPELDALIGLLNPTLLDVNFEVDSVLQIPVCRAVVRIDSDASFDQIAQEVIATLGSVSANFVSAAPSFLAVTSDGLSAREALHRQQPRDEHMKSLVGGNNEGK